MKYTVILLFIINVSLSAQKTIEVACSYDQKFLQRYGNATDAESEISWIMDEVNGVYDDFDINFNFVSGIQYLGNITLGGNVNEPLAVALAWARSENCYERDLVIHFTGSTLSKPSANGVATTGTLCESNNWDASGTPPVDFGIVVRDRGFWNNVRTAAHELGHGIGLNHEQMSYCDQIHPASSQVVPFMCCCGEGAFPSANSSWRLSQFNRNSLSNHVDNAPCVDRPDYDPNYMCTDFTEGWVLDREIRTECGEGDKLVTYIIKNDNATRTFRNNSIAIRPWSELDVSSPDIDITPSNGTLSSDDLRKLFFDDFTLSPNETFTIELNINYDNIQTNINSNNVLIFGNIRSNDVSPPIPNKLNGDKLNEQFLPEERSIVLSNNADINEVTLKIQQLENNAIADVTDAEIVIPGTLTIDQDLFIDGDYSLKMLEDSRIVVKSGSKFTMLNNSITSCDNERWDEIYLESGANLDFRNVFMESGKTVLRTEINNDPNGPVSDIMINSVMAHDFSEDGVLIKTKATSTITNTEIFLSNAPQYGIGCLLENNVELDKFENNKISGAWIGARLNHIDGFSVIEGLEIKDCIRGLMLINSTGIVRNNTFINNDYAIYAVSNTGMIIDNNTIGFNKTGIHISNCFSPDIRHNTIGSLNEYGDVGINIKSSIRTYIAQNPSIISSRFGIRAQNSNINVLGNPDITVIGEPNTNAGGVLVLGGTNNKVTNNYIFGTNVTFGVEMNNSVNSLVNNNQVNAMNVLNLFNTAGFKTNGSTTDWVEDNEFFASNSLNGIVSQNSTSGEFECNIISDAVDGILIQNNAENQKIRGNNINATNVDLTLRSMIGDQVHEGNDFVGGKARAILSLFELSESEFTVNSNQTNHLPSDLDPGLNSWFFVDNSNVDFECIGVIGPTYNLFDNDNICSYYEFIKDRYSENTNIFNLKLIHLLKYRKTSEFGSIPNCITTDSTFQTLCDIGSLVDIVIDITEVNVNIGSFENSDDILDEISETQARYFGDEDAEETIIEELRNSNELYKDLFELEMDKDSLVLDSLLEKLMLFECFNEVIEKSALTWSKYIETLQYNEIVESVVNDELLQQYSVLCSGMFGDFVHLSRGLSSYYVSDYYDTYDIPCLEYSDEESENRNKKIAENLDYKVYPNPSTGNIYVELPNEFNGYLKVLSIDGQQLTKRYVSNGGVTNINIDRSGIYLVSIENEKDKFVRKIFINN